MVVGQAGGGLDVQFSHVAIGVSDVDRSLEFYRDLLGMDVVFDRRLSGAPFAGRAAGGLIGGIFIELLCLDGRGVEEGRVVYKSIGVQVLSLSVRSIDDSFVTVRAAVGDRAQKPFEVDGVRMFFVTDPDGTVLEFIEFPGAARTPIEFHRGVEGGRQ